MCLLNIWAAIELAEAGVSSISVGVYGLNSWADNSGDTSSLEISSGSAETGARTLVQLSQKLNGL